MSLLVGCPVYRREWVLPRWFEHIEKACRVAGFKDWGYVFAADAQDPTTDMLRELAGARLTTVVLTDDDLARPDVRDWTVAGRYEHMVTIRNALLDAVRDLSPSMFLSIDSDMLIHPQALAGMVSMLADGYDAVGAKAYMTKRGTAAPSYAHFGVPGGLARSDSSGNLTVHAIMAIKLMTSAAYHIDYVAHQHGEDIGWSRAAGAADLKLGWYGQHCSKHVLDADMLLAPDPRCGF